MKEAIKIKICNKSENILVTKKNQKKKWLFVLFFIVHLFYHLLHNYLFLILWHYHCASEAHLSKYLHQVSEEKKPESHACICKEGAIFLKKDIQNIISTTGSFKVNSAWENRIIGFLMIYDFINAKLRIECYENIASSNVFWWRFFMHLIIRQKQSVFELIHKIIYNRFVYLFIPDSWLQDDINKGKAENLFFLFAVLTFVNFILFIFVAKRYKYSKEQNNERSHDTCHDQDDW